MRWFIVLVSIFTFSGMQPVSAMRQLSEEDAVEMALRRDPELQRSAIAADAAERTLARRWGIFLPNITAQGGTTYSAPLFSEERRPNPPQPWSQSASLGVSLQLSPAVAPQISLLTVQRDLAILTQQERVLTLANQIRRRYYGLILTREQLSLLQEDIRLAEEQVAQATTRFNQGRISQRVVLQTQLAAERARLTHRQREAEYALELTRFRSLIGLPEGEQITLTGTFDLPLVDIPAVDVLLSLPAAPSPGVLRQEETLRNARIALQQEILATRSPTLSLSSNWSNTFREQWSDSLSFSLGVSVPLDGYIPASPRGQRVERAEVQVEQARITRSDQVEQFRLTTGDIAAQIRQAREQMTIADLQITVAQEILVLAQDGFDRGTVERLELERAQRDVLDARLNRLAADHRYTLAMNDLAQHLGVAHPRQLTQMVQSMEQ